MDQGNRLCVNCEYRVAEFFCSCTDPGTFLCEACLGKHSRLASSKGHQTWPISLALHNKDPRYLARMQALPRVSEQGRACIGEVEQAITEITARMQELQAALTVFCMEKIRKLQEIKAFLTREITIALEEVERTLAEEDPRLITQYGPAFRARTENMSPLALFTCLIETSAPQALLRIESRVASPQELSSTTLTGVFGGQAFVYDISSQRITKHAISVNFGAGGSYLEVDKNTLLCVGADPASSDVYMLKQPSFRLFPLPGLSVPRFAAGVALARYNIYVFGGQDAVNVPLRSCEKMQVAGAHWTNINSMAFPRGGFTPCHFRALIYLVSAWSSAVGKVETFNPETDTFVVLPISLPLQLTFGTGSVSFVINGELCLITRGRQMARWKIDTEREFRLSSTGDVMLGNQQPVIVGSVVLIVCCGGVDQFSLQTYSHIKYVS